MSCWLDNANDHEVDSLADRRAWDSTTTTTTITSTLRLPVSRDGQRGRVRRATPEAADPHGRGDRAQPEEPQRQVEGAQEKQGSMSSAPISIRSTTVRRRKQAAGRASRAQKVGVVSTCLTLAVVAFITSAALSWLVSSTLHEQARRQTMEARERERAARHDVTFLRQRVDRLTSVAEIDLWASSRGFVGPTTAIEEARDADAQPETSPSLVAVAQGRPETY